MTEQKEIKYPMSLVIRRATDDVYQTKKVKIENLIKDYIRGIKDREIRLKKMKRCLDSISENDLEDYINGDKPLVLV